MHNNSIIHFVMIHYHWIFSLDTEPGVAWLKISDEYPVMSDHDSMNNPSMLVPTTFGKRKLNWFIVFYWIIL